MFGEKTLRAIVSSVIDSKPDRTPEEEHHLAYPVNEEAAALLSIKETLPSLPMEGLEEAMPLFAMVLEDLALDAQRAGDEGAETRERVKAWLEQLRVALS